MVVSTMTAEKHFPKRSAAMLPVCPGPSEKIGQELFPPVDTVTG